jgi:hypothetical protein
METQVVEPPGFALSTELPKIIPEGHAARSAIASVRKFFPCAGYRS